MLRHCFALFQARFSMMYESEEPGDITITSKNMVCHLRVHVVSFFFNRYIFRRCVDRVILLDYLLHRIKAERHFYDEPLSKRGAPKIACCVALLSPLIQNRSAGLPPKPSSMAFFHGACAYSTNGQTVPCYRAANKIHLEVVWIKILEK
jgi:hypothetical protein